nr:MAG TPA: hypothetical protein [Caudoviricetes sp.]
MEFCKKWQIVFSDFYKWKYRIVGWLVINRQ